MAQLLKNREEIILASGSPRRFEYLTDLGLLFRVQVPAIEETKDPYENSVAYISRLAREKAQVVAAVSPGAWVLAADTVVCLDESVLEKPVDEMAAVAMLMRLSGQEHTVRTALCLLHGPMGISEVCVVATVVRFWDFTEEMIRSYVQTGESMDKAGGYGIQGKGAFLVREIHGSYSNVVGLPLCELIEMLLRHKIIFRE